MGGGCCRREALGISTLDSDSSDRGSNPRGVLLWIVVSILRRGGLFPARVLHASCGSYVGLRVYAVRYMGPRGVTVRTLDSESSDRGSNPREVSYGARHFALRSNLGETRGPLEICTLKLCVDVCLGTFWQFLREQILKPKGTMYL